MIKNERQYKITTAQVQMFARALESLKQETQEAEVHPLLVKAQEDAVTSQLADLEAASRAYESFRVTSRS
ncbi:MAG: hypothetical protein EXR50_03305 [Dehalococcoidia bacterium]|nr:hypothetical protein [Dehalococcoidia bacterium]